MEEKPKPISKSGVDGSAAVALTPDKDRRDEGMRLLASYVVPLLMIFGVVLMFVLLVQATDVEQWKKNANVTAITNAETPLEKELKTVLPKEDTIVNVLQELQIISLVDRTGQGYFGNGSREMRDGVFSVSVMANLSDPDAGFYYEAWIQRAYPFQMISLGRMAKNQQGRYAMNFRQEKNLLDFEHLVITKEQDDQNSSPSEQTMLEGSFTED